jgi:NADPH:quinone reductase
MRAIVAERFGGYQNLKLADIPEPTVSNGRVLVRIAAAGVCGGSGFLDSGIS